MHKGKNGKLGKSQRGKRRNGRQRDVWKRQIDRERESYTIHFISS